MSDAPQELSFEEIKNIIHPVKDPEIGLSLVELGLIYDGQYDPAEKHAVVKMTLTSQMCPAGPEMMNNVKAMAEQHPAIDLCEVELVWTPRWDPKIHCSEDAKAILGIWD